MKDDTVDTRGRLTSSAQGMRGGGTATWRDGRVGSKGREENGGGARGEHRDQRSGEKGISEETRNKWKKINR